MNEFRLHPKRNRTAHVHGLSHLVGHPIITNGIITYLEDWSGSKCWDVHDQNLIYHSEEKAASVTPPKKKTAKSAVERLLLRYGITLSAEAECYLTQSGSLTPKDCNNTEGK